MTAALQPGQYELDGFIFGAGSNYIWIESQTVDPGSMVTQDQALPGVDGVQFGIDTMAGVMITYTGNIYVPPHRVSEVNPYAPAVGVPAQGTDIFTAHRSGYALNAYNNLASKWNDPTLRLNYNAVVALRVRYPFSDSTRVIYGRGRKIMPTMGMVHAGVVPFTAQFQSGDWVFYQDAINDLVVFSSKQFSLYAPPFNTPTNPPYTTAFQQSHVVNTGTLPTWPVITFYGPCSFPHLDYVDANISIGYGGYLDAKQAVTIDTRPWARYAVLGTPESAFHYPWVLGGGQVNPASWLDTQTSTNILSGTAASSTAKQPSTGPVAGLLTGNRMADLSLPAGSTKVSFKSSAPRGLIGAGHSVCEIRWQSAEAAIGGILT